MAENAGNAANTGKTAGKEQKKPRVLLRTFGCQMNQYDSGVVENILAREGYRISDKEDEADIVIVNTCSVRQHAEDRAYGYLREMARVKKERKLEKQKDMTLVVMGCMAQREGSRIFEIIPEADIVCGVESFKKIPLMLEGRGAKEVAANNEKYGLMQEEKIERQIDISRPLKFKGNSRDFSIPQNNLKGYVAVMRGCSNYCSYCVVPAARGEEKSRAIKDICDEVERLAERGVKEVTLLGQNINAYGKDLGNGARLVDVLREVNKINGLLRIRFITSHPRDVERELFTAMRDTDKVMEYLHLPLQSGSDRILKLMQRGYTLRRYLEIVEEFRKILPEASLGTDLIAGFPGETDKEFKETLKAVEEIEFDMAYMYKYSARPGTKASGMEGAVSEELIKERHQRLLKLQEEISLKKNRALIGKQLQVLVEGRSRRNPDRLSGRDRGNRNCVFEGSDDLIGKMGSVPIFGATHLTLYGERVK